MLKGIFTKRTVFGIVLLTALLSVGALYVLSQAQTIIHSGTMVEIGVPELTLRAKSVVVGTVADKLPSRKSVDRQGDPIIYTDWVVEVQRMVKGEAAERITVRTLGGRVGLTEMVAEDQPTFQVGERVLLFLNNQDRDGAISVLGGDVMWTYRIESEGGRDMARRELLGTVEPLNDLITRIEQAMAGGGLP